MIDRAARYDGPSLFIIFILRVSVDKLKFHVGRFVFRRLEAAVPRLPLGRVTAPIG